MDLPEEAKRAPSAPVWNQSFPSPRRIWLKRLSELHLPRFVIRVFLLPVLQYCTIKNFLQNTVLKSRSNHMQRSYCQKRFRLEVIYWYRRYIKDIFDILYQKYPWYIADINISVSYRHFRYHFSIYHNRINDKRNISNFSIFYNTSVTF